MSVATSKDWGWAGGAGKTWLGGFGWVITYNNLVKRSAKDQTSWSLVGPGVEVGLMPHFIDYLGVSLK